MQASLRQEIIRLRIENILLRAKLAGMKKDLSKFITKYMLDMQDLFSELSDIQGKKNVYESRLNDVYIKPDLEKTPQESDYEIELKRLQRKLLKQVHPDVAKDKGKAALHTRMVQDAYSSRNLPYLIRMDEELSGQRSYEQDKKIHHSLIGANYNLSLELTQIQESAEYQLKESFGRQVSDDNIISAIRLKLKRRIAEEKRKLLAYKLDYLEAMQKRIVA